MKRLFAALIALTLVFALCLPALAANDYDLVYDATDMLDAEVCGQLGYTALPELSEKYSVQIRIDVVDDLEGHTVEEYANIFYEQYGYGYTGTLDGILLMIYLTEDDSGLAFGGYCLKAGGRDEASLGAIAESVSAELGQWLNADSWSGDLVADNAAFYAATQAYAAAAESCLDGAELVGAAATAAPVPGTDYVTDAAGILTQGERLTLSARAEAISEEYGCGVYIVTVEDYSDYGSSPRDAAEEIYRSAGLGLGEDKSGELLMLSLSGRDYALIAYGYGNTAFTDYGKDVLSESFLDNFADNDWAGGFKDYLSESESMLKTARNGHPYDIYNSSKYVSIGFIISVVLAAIIAFVLCGILSAGMKSVEAKKEAAEYIPANGCSFTVRDERFTNRTVSRVKIERSSGGGSHGGTSVSSSGFSGKSGKF